MEQLTVIAKALGAARCREELLPFLTEFTDDDDEVLVELGKQIRKLIPYVGGEEYAYTLLAPLEELAASVDDAAVRVAAVQSLQEVRHDSIFFNI